MSARVRCMLVILTLWPVSVFAQKVAGVTLGKTTVVELTSLRGEAADTGRNNDGWYYLSYGRAPGAVETFYYSAADSIVEWLRVFPEPGRTAARVREAFGKPDTVNYGDDLAKIEVYRDGRLFVAYTNANTVNYIEHHPTYTRSIAVRRAILAETTIDSLMAENVSLRTCIGDKCLPFATGLASVRKWKALRGLKGTSRLADQSTVDRVRASDSVLTALCIEVRCTDVRRRFRAWDSKP